MIGRGILGPMAVHNIMDISRFDWMVKGKGTAGGRCLLPAARFVRLSALPVCPSARRLSARFTT